jgi:FdhD protein
MELTERQTQGAAGHTIWKVEHTERTQQEDRLAIEAPLEISLAYGAEENRTQRSVSITMRTPGQDFALALGFLFTEGMVRSLDQVREIRHLDAFLPEMERNQVLIDLQPDVPIDLDRLERHFYTSSSCGVCGKSSIEAVRVSHDGQLLPAGPKVDAALIHELPGRLRQEQVVFDCTGGLHASALFSRHGEMLQLSEDVGRHNALDKLIGECVQQQLAPLTEHVLSLSGRISFELVQKAYLAGIPVVVAVGAPSSLAVELAEEVGMTLVGFARDGKFNIYTHPERIV